MHCNGCLEARKPKTHAISPLVPADVDFMVHKSLIFSAVHEADKLRNVCIVFWHIFSILLSHLENCKIYGKMH
jgi:hypothetical protein